MISRRRRITLSVLIVTVCASLLPAQTFYGADNFDDNSLGAEWSDGTYALSGNAGTWTKTNGRLEYTGSGTDSSSVLVWSNYANPSFNENWTASLSVASLATVSAGYSVAGIQVFSANADYGFVSLLAYNSAVNGRNVLFEKGHSTDGTGATYTWIDYIPDTPVTDLSNLLLSISFDASTKNLTLQASADGGVTPGERVIFNPLTGVSSSWADEVTAGDWYGVPSDGFSVRIIARSTVESISAGQIYVDNFSVSAVPEPASWAAIAGLAFLGLATTRRRPRPAKTTIA